MVAAIRGIWIRTAGLRDTSIRIEINVANGNKGTVGVNGIDKDSVSCVQPTRRIEFAEHVDGGIDTSDSWQFSFRNERTSDTNDVRTHAEAD